MYPEPGQRAALARAFGCARVVFNDGLRARQEAHAAGRPYISDTGKRNGPKVAPPRFKSRKDPRQSIRLTANGFTLRDNGRLYVAKVGNLRVKWSRVLRGTVVLAVSRGGFST